MARAMVMLPLACCALTVSAAGSAAATVDLVFAQRPSSLAARDKEIDDIILGLNEAFQKADGSGDVACDVNFVRTKPVIRDARLPDSGDWSAHLTALKEVAPTADFLIVQSLSCLPATTNASGCATKGKPASVIYDGYRKPRTSIVWGHEQGHRRGMHHVGQGIAWEQASKAQRTDVMFWDPRPDSRVLTTAECQTYGGTARAGGGSFLALLMVADNTAVATDFGLTPPAFALLDAGWAEELPLDAIKALAPEDIAGILQVFDHEDAHPLWANALTVLGVLGDDSAADSMRRLLEKPMPEVSDAATEEQLGYARDLLRAKLAVPVSIGFLLNRNPSRSDLGALLEDGLDRQRAQAVVTPEFEADYRKAVVYGLAYAGSPLLATVPQSGDDTRRKRVQAELSGIAPEEAEVIGRIAEDVRTRGLDELLAQPPHPDE